MGHFLTVIKDFSKTGGDDQFVRYVNRWDLRKAEPSAAVSPPVTPIIFWIEKTVPFKYRGAVREGILEWNKAFEQAGFSNAIEVRQQPDDATWDPEDINYNTFRWITANAGFAMGPSRVNPMTGQILDADIIFDADFVDVWTKQLDVEKTGRRLDVPADAVGDGQDLASGTATLALGLPAARDATAQVHRPALAFGAMALAAGGKPLAKEQIDKLLVDGVKSVVIHEVGHTLGLRHNFKASAYADDGRDQRPRKEPQPSAWPPRSWITCRSTSRRRARSRATTSAARSALTTIGRSNTPTSRCPAAPRAKSAELAKIASRCTEPALQYATDEDTGLLRPRSAGQPLRPEQGPDRVRPLARRIDQPVVAGPGRPRRRAGRRLPAGPPGVPASCCASTTGAMGFVARYIGGVYVNRNHKGDPNARPPFVVVEPKKQREALAFLEQQCSAPTPTSSPRSSTISSARRIGSTGA